MHRSTETLGNTAQGHRPSPGALGLPAINILCLRKSAEPTPVSNPCKQKSPRLEEAALLSVKQEPKRRSEGGRRASRAAEPLQQRRRTSRQPSCRSRRGADPARGRQRAGTRGVCCSIQTSGWRAPGSGSSAMWSNLGGGWQTYCTRTETAVHHQGWKGSCRSSSALRAPSRTQEAAAVPRVRPGVCGRTAAGQTQHRHPRQMAAPRPRPIPHKNYINLNKAWKGGKKAGKQIRIISERYK